MASTRKGGRRGARKGAVRRKPVAQRTQRSPLADYALGDTLRLGLVGPVRAAVYRPTGGEVAVEQVPEHLRKQRAFTDALARAGNAASTVRHPRVAAMYDVVSGKRELRVVGALVRGTLLSDAAAWVPALAVIDSFLEALDVVHAHGMAHGSVSPRCLVLQEDGGICLTELGLSEAVCLIENRECSVAADLVAAAKVGVDLLRRSPPRQRRTADHRRALRALRQVVAAQGRHGTLSSAASIRAAVAPPTVEPVSGSERRRSGRGLRRLGLAVAPVVVGTAAGLTVAAATGATPASPPLALSAAPRVTAYPATGGCGTTFTFTATGPVRGAGVFTYQWLRSDGAVGPVRHLPVGRFDASLRVTNTWTLTTHASGAITMTLRVLSPAHLSASRTITATCT